MHDRPTSRPANPCFSSGPCAKRPGWSLPALSDALLGRSHRAPAGKAKLQEVIIRTRDLLRIPDDYQIAVVPASDTGAMEMAMWSMLGARGVDIAAWESFGLGWVTDATKQLPLDDVRALTADYGDLPDLTGLDGTRDLVFTWNGTTSGVRVPDGDIINSDRKGITICDATSAAFAMVLPWDKLDVTTWSWQKVMGGEAAHGMLVLGPRAVERLETYTPKWPLPKLFRMTKGGKLTQGLFEGSTINTPSMLCVEDALDGLRWAEQIGGLSELTKRSSDNLNVFEKWVAQRSWIDFLALQQATRSSTSICFRIVDEWYESLSDAGQASKVKDLVKLMEAEQVAYDIGAYRDAPPGLRIWGGSTIETADVAALTGWLDWGFEQIRS
ncbi:MAG TPA: phosphoserine transaminase [Candidatus Latescibacteria bacterium]|nr:phosphoserine transaminase [Gemmatimonadota bacterium]MDP7633288.1 phosphoserine transaminase [Candidatus Latescibacterota bacterium]HJN27811.1 phosphoserine transaminase [Candidatus Latescibacterota bacterium]